MRKQLAITATWLPMAGCGFIAGVIVFGLVSGQFTGSRKSEIEQSRQQGYAAGYSAAQAESPTVDIEEHAIHIISNAVFMENMEVELKAIARLTNAIEFTYGEKGGHREHVSALDPGDAIAQRIGNNLYVIKNLSVSANLQRATIQVTRIALPPT